MIAVVPDEGPELVPPPALTPSAREALGAVDRLYLRALALVPRSDGEGRAILRQQWDAARTAILVLTTACAVRASL